MATLASPDSTSPPPMGRRTKSCARKCERACCTIATYFPLAFVYSLTTWAVWVEAGMGFSPTKSSWTGLHTSLLGIALYILLNGSYTIAVFTDPGSPATSSQTGGAYSHLPTSEPTHDNDPVPSITVSSSGAPRYCKKCLCRKPDRAHHCSTCRRCVLKMDHHCPWLATCVGLHNYKPFLLFLIYTCVFCWVCFGVSALWCWTEVLSDGQYVETMMPINVVLLAVISGIIGLVLTGFTIWHISLAVRGMTTIECLEKTRYLSPMRRQMQRQQQNRTEHSPNGVGETLQRAGQHFLEIHANAVPGATRLEEGEERPSPKTSHPPARFSRDEHQQQSTAQQALYRNYSDMEASRERDRYEDYLDDQESEKLPNAFDLGWRRNLRHLFGERPLFWFLPVCNTTGDGWRWETSLKWRDATEQARIQREQQRSPTPDYHHSQGQMHNDTHLHSPTPRRPGGGAGRFYYDGPAPPSSSESATSAAADDDNSDNGMSMHTLHPPPSQSRRANVDRADDGSEVDYYEVSSDEEAAAERRRKMRGAQARDWRNDRGDRGDWNEWD